MICNDLRLAGIGTCPQARLALERNGFDWQDLRAGKVHLEMLHEWPAEQNDYPYIRRLIKAVERRLAREARRNGR